MNAHEANGVKFQSIWSAVRTSPSLSTGSGAILGYILGSALGVPGFLLAGAGATAGPSWELHCEITRLLEI